MFSQALSGVLVALILLATSISTSFAQNDDSDRPGVLKVLQIGESVPIDSGDADAEDKTRRPDRLARGSIL
jgi:hypothetical protein